MKTRPEILQGVQECIATYAGIKDPRLLTTDARLYHDLGTKTLCLIAVVAAVEERFGFMLSLEAWTALAGRDGLTVGDLAEVVADRLAAQQPAPEQVLA